MTLGVIIDNVLDTLGKETYSGVVTPDNINTAVTWVNDTITEKYIKNPDDAQRYLDVCRNLITYAGDNVTPPITINSWGYGELPTDYEAFLAAQHVVYVNNNGTSTERVVSIQALTNAQFDAIVNASGIAYRPSKNRPISTIQAGQLLVRPKDITDVNLRYFRTPATPFFDYDIDVASSQWYYLPPGSVHDGTNPNFAVGAPSLSVEFEFIGIDEELVGLIVQRYIFMAKDYQLQPAVTA